MHFSVHLLYQAWSFTVLNVWRKLFLVGLSVSFPWYAYKMLLHWNSCFLSPNLGIIWSYKGWTCIHLQLTQKPKKFISGEGYVQTACKGTRLLCTTPCKLIVSAYLHLTFRDLIHAKPIKEILEHSRQTCATAIFVRGNFTLYFENSWA